MDKNKYKNHNEEVGLLKNESKKDHYGTYKFAVKNGNFDDYEVKITYTPKGKGKSDRTSKNAEVYDKSDTKTPQTEGSFKIKVPEGATDISIEVQIRIKDATVITETKLITEVWNCVSIAGDHGSKGCHLGCTQVQRMTRSWTDDLNEYEDKTLKLKINTDGTEYGNIRVIKTDKLTGEALKPTASSKTKFKIRQYDSDEDEDKYAEYTAGTNVKFTKNGQTFEIGDNGWTDITNVPLDDKYEYYLEEVESQTGYKLLEDDIEISVSNSAVTDITKVKRATNYLFARNAIKKALVNKCTEDNTLNKNKYKSCVYNLILGNPIDKSVKDSIINDIDVDLSNTPTNSEIKELVYYILDNYVKDESRLTDIMKKNGYIGKDYFNHIINELGNVKIASGSLAKARAYMEGCSPNIVQNEKMKGLLQVLKIDADTRKPLADATFRIHGISAEDGGER